MMVRIQFKMLQEKKIGEEGAIDQVTAAESCGC